MKMTKDGKREYFYSIYHNIRQRCNNKNSNLYKDYGGRGITFDWKTYEAFKRDMYKSWVEHKKKHSSTTIERIDNNGNYSKENCRWATMKEQTQNRRSNRYITYKGKTLLLIDWARELGVSRQVLDNRLKRGWSIKKTLTTPVK